MYIIGSNYLTH